ncbi:DUF4240 domain-containing protein [Kribbella sp. NPDC005582]|uniref:DUF4240 domain-containing protein n=1 Tax=Kribbella sp. NPDC005582 TaxID=3156893 RepID=UPI0033B5C074
MQVNEFWSLVERAREDASVEGVDWPSGSAVAEALAAGLAQLSAERIIEFDHAYQRTTRRADQWALCAAAYVIWGYISDDAFSDFKAGLVGLGRDAFEQATADADALADHPMVQAIAAGQVDRFALAAEGVQYAAARAFEQHNDDADAFWDALEAQPDEAGDQEELPGADRWSGRFGGAEDLTLIPQRLPRLLALFSERGCGGH